MTKKLGWITTFTGKQFNIADFLLTDDPFSASLIDIRDIAHSLALTCRFAGHCKSHFSVAEHSLYVASEVARRYTPALFLEGLMHDATEAYIHDISKPLKELLPEYQIIEHNLDKAIRRRFCLFDKIPEEVKKVDYMLLVSEAKHVGIKNWEKWMVREGDTEVISLDKMKERWIFPNPEEEFLRRFHWFNETF